MTEEPPDSFLLRIKPLLESEGPFLHFPEVEEAAAEGDALESEPSESGSPGGSFSALDLRDRVVVMLLFGQVVQVEQVEEAWHQWQNEAEDTPDALWRVVARRPDVDDEAAFATAARVYAFESAASILYRSRALLRAHRGRFSLRQRRHLVALGVLPVKIDETPEGPCWIFATHDPARPAVQRLLAKLDVPAYELQYGPAEAIRERLVKAFPGEAALGSRSAEDDDTDDAAAAPVRSTLEARGKGGLAALDDLLAEDAEAQTSKAQTSKARRLRGRETVRTFASIYEELLAGAARSGASCVRLTSDVGEERDAEEADEGERFLAVFEYDERDEHREVALRVPPGAVLSFMRRRTRSARHGTASKDQKKRVHRWIDDRRHSFSIAPLPDRSGWEAGRAEIVIEVAK
jgi:ketosteroid isomerase-like protein